MRFTATSIPEIILIEPKVFCDSRGFFMETYQAELFTESGIPAVFVQDNHSRSKLGTLRGLHYQLRQAQGKLVRVVLGAVYDVIVDLRRSSPSFGKWVGTELSAENKLQIWMPPGFAHGFYVLSQWAEVVYKTTDYYAPEWERTLLWNDPEVGIQWPLQEGVSLTISPKDLQGKPLREVDPYD